jgi:hypothetical protein
MTSALHPASVRRSGTRGEGWPERPRFLRLLALGAFVPRSDCAADDMRGFSLPSFAASAFPRRAVVLSLPRSAAVAFPPSCRTRAYPVCLEREPPNRFGTAEPDDPENLHSNVAIPVIADARVEGGEWGCSDARLASPPGPHNSLADPPLR